MIRPLLSICLILVAPAVLSQETDLFPKTKPVPAIAQADWVAYRDDYQQSPLCDQEEATLRSCEADNRVFSLCSSPVLNRTSIAVTGPAPAGRSSEIECDGNQKLQLNYTMRLMHDSGLWER
ncbi:hypothetical protein [Vreelandella profundi]|uniref:hypothetical protein n=1 Tax=Vreelandella profundi TaxID=2852117 RepID=UPI001EEFC141|nr:hypothetical protein [Halomonas profundi]